MHSIKKMRGALRTSTVRWACGALAAIALLVTAATAFASKGTAPSSLADIKYSYTDDQGREQTATLNEVAKGANQIIAFLEEVYTNSEVPGTVELPDGIEIEVNGQKIIQDYAKVDYAGPSKGWYDWIPDPQIDDNGSPAITPEQDGMTMLLVVLKDNAPAGPFNSFKEMVEARYESVRVVPTASKAMAGSNPDASAFLLPTKDLAGKTFFFMSKGKLREVDYIAETDDEGNEKTTWVEGNGIFEFTATSTRATTTTARATMSTWAATAAASPSISTTTVTTPTPTTWATPCPRTRRGSSSPS